MKIAIIQDGPIYYDLNKTLKKTADYLKEAKANAADLAVFGECWLSGYPIWLDIGSDINLWDSQSVKEVWAEMYHNSICVISKEMDILKKSIKNVGMWVVMGVNEVIHSKKGNSTIYNTILTFNPQGEIVNHHRKLKPTYTEKLVHGPGDGAGLKSIETNFGRLGSLICWEHWMPMARQAMHDSAEDLHVALWPYAKEMHQLASRHYAHEGRCHVVAVGQIMKAKELPKQISISSAITLDEDGLVMKGGSAIYGPDGSTILSPQYGFSKIIIQELDLGKNLLERMNLSVSGHYQRHDIFNYSVDKSRHI